MTQNWKLEEEEEEEEEEGGRRKGRKKILSLSKCYDRR